MYNAMTMMNKAINILTLALMIPVATMAQVEERTRPAEWNQLVRGGRHMDRFETMPDGRIARANWGTEAVRNRLVDNGIECDTVSYWGGNIIRDQQGTYHLYVCGWPEDNPRGHMYWRQSTMYHATSQRPDGPYRIQSTIGAGHNPEAYVLDDGRVVVYCIDGYYIADGFDGPWTYGKFEFDTRGHRIIEGLSNLTFCRRADGSRMMVCRGGGVWVSRDGLQPWRQLTDHRIYPDVKGEFEDPVVWRDSLQYHLIVNDWLGRIAWYERSLDGLHWVVEPGEAYTYAFSRHTDGTVEPWFKYERPKVLQDEYGRVTQMNFAVIDTLKNEDRQRDTHSSKNICISMNKGLLLEIQNTQPIDAKTKKIVLRIRGEKDFDPVKEVDVKSLRLGSYTEVNYGRGVRARGAKRDGRDLIVTFHGKGSGIDAAEWAPKLIGSTKGGRLLWGYARLPYVNYQPAVLSASAAYMEDGIEIVKVGNYGLSPSSPQKLKVRNMAGQLVEVGVPAMMPYAEARIHVGGK